MVIVWPEFRGKMLRLILIVLVALTGCTPLEERVPIVVGEWCADPRNVELSCVIDGDTLDVDGCGGSSERIRLLGVAAPEIAHGGTGAECHGDASHSYLDDVATGRMATLEFDVECTDIYDRTLAWITISGDSSDPIYSDLEGFDDLGIDIGVNGEGTFEVLLNELMIRAGKAKVYDEPISKDVRYREQLEDAQTAAEADGIGLWGECVDD